MKAATKKKVEKSPARPAKKVAPKGKPQNATFGDHQGRERGHRYAKIIARAWIDDEFKQRLMTEPKTVFAEYQLSIPAGQSIQVATETPAHKQAGIVTFVLPPRPSGWTELESRPLRVSVDDDWFDGASTASKSRASKQKPKPKPPCAKCWNGCC